jgi:HSP20 family protein
MNEKTSAPVKTGEAKPRVWEPGDLFASMQDEMARLFDERWPSGAWHRLTSRMTPGGMTWAPKVDVFDRNGDLVVKAELPGIAKEDVEVSVDRGALVIKGERKAEEKVEQESYYRMERTFGSFYRRLPLPEGVATDKISAAYSDGVLEVRVPKPAEEKPQPSRITIS